MRRFDDIASLDATGQAELVARGDVQPIELVDIAIERLELVNPTINAVVA
jgi:amidase